VTHIKQQIYFHHLKRPGYKYNTNAVVHFYSKAVNSSG